jgi:hypothetical protein
MPNFIITHYQNGMQYKDSHFFIQSQGVKSGKPQKKPFPRCFVITFSNPEDADSIYCLAYSQWQSNFWHYFLQDATIPYLSIEDFRQNFSKKLYEMLADFEAHQKDIKTLRLLESIENPSCEQINQMRNIRRTILERYRKK